MPRSPTPLTVASFLLQRPRLKEDPVPKKRGRKRNLVVSPPNNKSPLDPKNFPPLAKKVSRSTPENSPLPPPNQDQTPLITSSLSPICRMSDSQSIELDEGHLLDDEEGMEFSHVSPAEAAELLELDTESAIDKHIREEEVKLAELRAALLKARAKTQKPPNNEPNILPPSNPAPSSFSSAPPPMSCLTKVPAIETSTPAEHILVLTPSRYVTITSFLLACGILGYLPPRALMIKDFNSDAL